jgi:hypothetical protein
LKESNDHPLNWIERQHLAEGHLQDERDALWQDICAALEDASRSFNKLYQGKSDTESINGHRFRISYQPSDSNPRRDIDLDFNEETSKITAKYAKSNHPSCVYRIEADHLEAFIADEKGNRISADEVSQQILGDVFFPHPQRAVWHHERLI